MAGTPTTNQHAGNTLLMQRPSEGEVCRGVAGASTHFEQARQAALAFGLEIDGLMSGGDVEAGSRLRTAQMLAGEETCAQGTVGDEGHALLGAEGPQRRCGVAHGQIVVILQEPDAGQLFGFLLV